MEKVLFDSFADTYIESRKKRLGLFGINESDVVRYKIEYMEYILKRDGFIAPNTQIYEGGGYNILEFGCGIGNNIPCLKEFFPRAKLYGCDPSEKEIMSAEQKHGDCAFNVVQKPEELSIYKDKIDVVFISMVMHHIPHCEHQAWISALFNIMKENSRIIIFENNPYNPLTMRFAKGLDMDKDAVWLKPRYCKNLVRGIFGSAKLRYSFFFPWRDKFWTALERKIARVPLGAQYYVTAIKTKKYRSKLC